MIFTDLRFLALFAACWVNFHAAPARWRSVVLAGWGAVFYALYAGWMLVLVAALVATASVAGRRSAAWVAGGFIVGLLVAFKAVADGLVAPPGAGWLMPLGFSYLSFELLHVVIERRRGRLDGTRLDDLMAYALFFPCRIAGPIRRLPDFTAAVADARPTAANLHDGLLRILSGLAKKLILADTLALTGPELAYVNSTAHAWTIVLAYTFRIYFDFSAYSDLAIGFARVLGIAVPENFAFPYLATDIRDFWNRWHITLSTWVRDYVFVPTGRALFGTVLRPWPALIAGLSYLLTFAVVGAWHGLTGAFLVWGLYQGVLLSAHHVLRARLPVAIAAHPWYRSKAASVLAGLVTFVCVAVGWVPFMADLATARRLLWLMFGGAS